MVDFIYVIIELFCYLLWMRRQKRKSVEVIAFRKRWVILSANFRHKGASTTNHQSDCPFVLYAQLFVWFCHQTRVCQTDRQTNGQNYDSQYRASIAASSVKITVRCFQCG